MSRLSLLTDLIKDSLAAESYDTHSLKILFKEYFYCVRNSLPTKNEQRGVISLPLKCTISSFNENDYEVGTKREGIEIYAHHWGCFHTNFYVKATTELDIIIRVNQKTNGRTLSLSGFQKRRVLDANRLKEDIRGKDIKYVISEIEDELIKNLKHFKEEWTYYTRVFENLDKIEIKQHINNDESCEISIEDATLADFLLFKDDLDYINNFVENPSYSAFRM